MGVLDATLMVQKLVRGKVARGKAERSHLAMSSTSSGKKQSPALAPLEAKDLATASARKRTSDMMKRSAHEQRQRELAAREALRMKLEAEAIELAARQAREEKAAFKVGVYARRLLATRKTAKLKQQRLLKSADHIDKAIMNGQVRAKLAEMREQKRKINEYIQEMSC